eukprot:442569_1
MDRGWCGELWGRLIKGNCCNCSAEVGWSCGGCDFICWIHETNLKKFGMLALTFDDKEDYNLIQTGDRISICGLTSFKPNKQLELCVVKRDGTKIQKAIYLNHTYNEEQIEWFKYGSSLNYIKHVY